MSFEPSEKVVGLMAQVEAFMEEHIFPRELDYWEWVDDGKNQWVYPPWFEGLKEKGLLTDAEYQAKREEILGEV